MIKIFQFLLSQFLFFKICSCFNQQQQQFTTIHSSKNRILTESYCLKYDKYFQNICIICADSFLLPDCNQCPIGQIKIGNQCLKCGVGQLKCDDQASELFCFKGYTKINGQCVCQPPKTKKQFWCTSENELYYLSLYQSGQINSKFSQQIIINDVSDKTQYEFNTDNCKVITNKADYVKIQSTMTCKINIHSKYEFIIILENSDVTDEYYKIIPKFDINKVSIYSQSQVKKAISIEYQKTTTLPNQYVNNNVNSIEQDACTTKNTIYRFSTGNNLFPKDEFIISGFKSAPLNFEVSFMLNEKDPSETQNLLDALNSKPNFIPFNFQQNLQRSDYFQVYYLQFYCQLPFDIKSSGIFKIQKIIGNFRFSVYFDTDEGKLPFLPNYVLFRYKMLNNVNDKLLSLFDDKEKFHVTIKILDNLNQEIVVYPSKIVQWGFFSDYIPIQNLEYLDMFYQLKVEVQDYQEYCFTSSKIKLYTVQSQNTIVSILNKDQFFNFNPRTNYQFQGQLSLQEDLGDVLDVQYLWNFGKRDFNDGAFETLRFFLWQQNDLQPRLWDDILDYSSTYLLYFYVTIILKNKPTLKLADVAYIYTFKETLIVNYQDKYKNIGLNNYEMLSFYLDYTDVSKLKRNTYNHYFKLRYYTTNNKFFTKYSGQIEPQFYFNANKYIPLTQEEFQDIQIIQFTFYVNDLYGNQIGASKVHTFKRNESPSSCEISLIINSDNAFEDKITIQLDYCSNPLKGDSNYYQFMYFNSQDLKNQEDSNPQTFKRKYLTKFQALNSFETVLPPGDLILAAYIKNNNEGRLFVFYQAPNIQSSSFNKLKYENFLISQEQLIDTYIAGKLFEEELCAISMLLEAIETYESSNQQKIDTSQLKMKLKSRLIQLPFLITSNPLVFDLQEFILRCLDRLYKTQDFPDSILTRFDDLNNIVKKKIDEIKTFITFLPESKATYQRSMKITFQLVIEYIKNISKIPQDLIPWNQKQIDSLFNIQRCISQTLNVNQEKIFHDGEFVTVEIQKVDSQILIKEYMQSLDIPLDREYDQKTIYNVLIQNWKQNIYQLDPDYIAQVSPYYSKVSSEIRLELDRIYPAINPYYIMETDETIDYSRRRRRRNLEFVESNNLVLPEDTMLKYQFKDIQGTGSVVCTQRISSVWSKKQCKTVVEKTENTHKVSCYCSSPSYTTLIYDIESLFDNENVDNIFSSSGIESLFSLENWYEYAAIYTIIVMNGVLIGSLIFASKLDKLFGLANTSVAAAILVTNEIKMEKQNSEKQNSIINEEKKNIEEQLDLNQDKKQDNQNDEQDIESKNKDSIIIKQSENKLFSRDRNITQVELLPTLTDTKQLLVTKLKKKSTLEINQIEEEQEDDKKQVLKKKGSNISQKINSTNNKHDKNEQSEENQKLEGKELSIENKQSKENQMSPQNILNKSPSITPLIETPQSQEINLEQQVKKIDKKQKQREFKKQENEKKKQENEKMLQRIKEKAEVYFNKLSIIRGVATFHILFQIFLVPNKKLSRTFRFCIYYSKLIWVLAINATFGSNITVSQVIILSVISSSSFAIYSKLLELLQFHKYARYGSYFLFICFLTFCYYATFISISSSSSSNSNMWMLSYFCTLLVNTIIIGSITSAIKLFITKKMLQKLKVDNFLFIITSADIIFEMFE